MIITYKSNVVPPVEDIIELYSNSGPGKPVPDRDVVARIYANSSLIVTAWHDEWLVGISRALTDFNYCCYIADLAVRQQYKCLGVGRNMIEKTKKIVGEGSDLILLSAPSITKYYREIGMEKVKNGFMIRASV